MPVKVIYEEVSSKEEPLTTSGIAELLEEKQAMVFAFQDYLFTNKKDSQGRILVFNMRTEDIYFVENSYYEMSEFLFDRIVVRASDFQRVSSYEITIKNGYK